MRRNKHFVSDSKKAQKLSREDFQLKEWIAANFENFDLECPDSASAKEAYNWWTNKARQTLDPELAKQVSKILANGYIVQELTDSKEFLDLYINLTCNLLDITL